MQNDFKELRISTNIMELEWSEIELPKASPKHENNIARKSPMGI